MISTILAYIITAVIFFYILRWLLRLVFHIVFSPAVIFAAIGTAAIVGIAVLITRRREAVRNTVQADGPQNDGREASFEEDVAPFAPMQSVEPLTVEDPVPSVPVSSEAYVPFAPSQSAEPLAVEDFVPSVPVQPLKNHLHYSEQFDHQQKKKTPPTALSDDFLEQIRYDEAIWRREQIKQASLDPPEEVVPNFVDCPACGKLISTKALFCPHCGCSVKQAPPTATPSSPVGSFLHIAGLDLQKGTFCSLSRSPEFISMNAPSRSFHLSQDSIHDVFVIPYSKLISLSNDVYTNEQISQSVKDTLKTTIEISSKKRFIQPHTRFMLITYTGEDEVDHVITFQLNDGNAKAAQQFASQYAEQAEHDDVFL